MKHGRPAATAAAALLPVSAYRPRAATALCRFAAGPGGIALLRDLQSCLAPGKGTLPIQFSSFK